MHVCTLFAYRSALWWGVFRHWGERMSLHDARRRYMVESQLRTNKVTSTRVLEAFEELPRENFVDKSLESLAYVDEDLDIGQGRFLLEPMVFARMVQALDLKETDNVLDIGAASGYSTAILSKLAQSVVGIEKNKDLANTGQNNLTDHGVDNAVVIEGDLVKGLADEAPYNAIIIEGSIESAPEKLLNQLNDDGRLITVLRPDPSGPGRVVKYVRAGDGFAHSVLFDAYTPILEDFMTDKGFDFAR